MDAFQTIEVSSLEHVTGGIGPQQQVPDKVKQLRERLSAPAPGPSRVAGVAGKIKHWGGRAGGWAMGAYMAYSFMPQSWQDAISTKLFGADKELPPLQGAE